MKKLSLWLTAILWLGTVLLTGCTNNNTTEVTPDNSTEEIANVELANPASVYCEENWWTLNLEEGSWLCMFDDGTYCEEWSYYRNECQKWDTFYNMVNSEWTEWDNIWMANPAAVFCVEQWGESYSLVDNEWNETWMCRLPDWNEVDEWGYYYSHN